MFLLFIFAFVNFLRVSSSQGNYETRSLLTIQVSDPVLLEGRISNGACFCGFGDACTNVCSYSLFVTVDDEQYRLFRVPVPSGRDSVLTTSTSLRKRHINITIYMQTENSELIDIWSMPQFAANPNQIVEAVESFGNFGNGRLSFRITWTCPQRFGYNCMQECGSINEFSFCEPTLGILFCTENRINAPLCEMEICDRSSCSNNGECVRVDEIFECQCDQGWTGPICEIRI